MSLLVHLLCFALLLKNKVIDAVRVGRTVKTVSVDLVTGLVCTV